jgi:peptidyl-prolyl cis-trans isomerase SurA
VDDLLEDQDALNIAYASGLAQQKDEPVLQEIWGTNKGTYGPIELSNGGFAVLYVEELLPAGPKALNEIKGLVIASYQDRLEKAWVAALKEKFEVKVDEAVKAEVFAELN